MSHAASFRRRLWAALFTLAAAFLWLGAPAAHAQVQVDLKLSRRAYILYEPLIATVTITNNAGRDITLEDAPNTPWLAFEVNQINGSMVQPYSNDYQLKPLTIPAGQSLQRKIDITPSFPIREFGTHRVRANIYFAEVDRYYSSNFATFDLTDGKLIWRQTVGVPGSSDDVRQVSLMTHQLPDKMLLYVRVRDEEGNNVYITRALGRMIITGRAPQEMFDAGNNLHVLQESMPGVFTYSNVDIDGRSVAQKTFVRQGKSRPTLVKEASGNVAVRGGQPQVAAATAVGPQDGPKLSDRPAGLPTGGPHR